MFSSYRTTITGIAAILGGLAGLLTALAHDGGPDYDAIAVSIGAIGSGVGLLCARDNNVTSEDAGATTKTPQGIAIEREKK